VGRRSDRDFDLFPAPVVKLGAYWLGSMRLAYRLVQQVEVFGRIENGFDANYQDVFGYNAPGRSVHAGFRVAFGL
jgi:vitamin B12 transporter